MIHIPGKSGLRSFGKMFYDASEIRRASPTIDLLQYGQMISGAFGVDINGYPSKAASGYFFHIFSEGKGYLNYDGMCFLVVYY